MYLHTWTRVLKRIGTWFSARPKLDNLYETRIARILDLFLLSSIAIVIAVTILLISISFVIDISDYFEVNPYQRLINCTVITVLVLCLRIILHKGYLKAIVRILSILFIVLPTLILYFNSQTFSIPILFYAISLILSASVLTWRETTLFGVFSCLCLFMISLLEEMAFLPLSSDLTQSSKLLASIVTFSILLCFLRFEIINRENLKETLEKLNLQIEDFNTINTQLVYTSLHDSLTDLPNRRLIQDHIEFALKEKKRYPESDFALLFFDLDHFKFINDTLGHATGDQVLIEFAKHLQVTIRNTDFAGRLAGDEFIVLLKNINDYQEAVEVAQRVIYDLETPFVIDGKSLTITSSIGIVYGNPEYSSASELLHAADIAMYQSKQNGRGSFAIFDEAISQQVHMRLALENDLPKAIACNEITAHFHPIFQLDTLKLSGFELLTRWQHPTRGTVSPEVFIPIAEKTNNIAELDGRILEQACQQFLVWQAAGLIDDETYLSANLSPKCFEVADFADTIARRLTKINFDPRNLVFEITEGSLIKNISKGITSLKALKAKGIKISIDDFGTGYSSLSSLHLLPLDTIKVDRSFVTQINEDSKNKHIVETITTLAKSLNMQIVAEGIEDIQQLGHLRSLKCDFGQGYYFTKPLDIDDTEVYLQSLKVHGDNYIFSNSNFTDVIKN